jgi:cytochrome c oxidase subunit II
VGSTATLIAVAYGVVVVLGIVLAVILAASTSGNRRPIDAEKVAHRERTWFFVVIAIMLTLLFATIWFTPYGKGSTSGDVDVNVTARQFLWTVKPNTFPANERIAFHLTSTDVNHGFGVYDPRGRFVVQVQVVPGKTQTLVHTFTKPGHYKILCLEFCGYGHALMQGVFTVTSR